MIFRNYFYVFDNRLGYGASLSQRSKVIAVNRDKGQLYKNAKIFWNPELAVQADVGTFFSKLKDELKKTSFVAPQDWLQKLRDRDEETEKKNAFKADQEADKYLNPVKVLHELDKVLPEGETYLVADGGDFVATASYIVRPKGPLKWLDPGAYGTLGCGGGFALGIKVSPLANHHILILCILNRQANLMLMLLSFTETVLSATLSWNLIQWFDTTFRSLQS